MWVLSRTFVSNSRLKMPPDVRLDIYDPSKIGLILVRQSIEALGRQVRLSSYLWRRELAPLLRRREHVGNSSLSAGTLNESAPKFGLSRCRANGRLVAQSPCLARVRALPAVSNPLASTGISWFASIGRLAECLTSPIRIRSQRWYHTAHSLKGSWLQLGHDGGPRGARISAFLRSRPGR